MEVSGFEKLLLLMEEGVKNLIQMEVSQTWQIARIIGRVDRILAIYQRGRRVQEPDLLFLCEVESLLVSILLAKSNPEVVQEMFGEETTRRIQAASKLRYWTLHKDNVYELWKRISVVVQSDERIHPVRARLAREARQVLRQLVTAIPVTKEEMAQ